MGLPIKSGNPVTELHPERSRLPRFRRGDCVSGMPGLLSAVIFDEAKSVLFSSMSVCSDKHICTEKEKKSLRFSAIITEASRGGSPEL